MNNKILLTTAVLFFQTILVIGQERSQKDPMEEFYIGTVSYTHFGESSFEEKQYEGKVGFSEVLVDLKFPYVLKNKKTIIINGVEFTNLKPNFSNEADASSSVSRNFYSVAYYLALNNRIGKQWSYSIGLKPAFASDFQSGISSDDFMLRGTALVSKQVSRSFKYGFGVSYNTRFGRRMVIPLVQLVYKKGHWGTYAYLPAYISQFYHLKNGKVGLSIIANGNNYNFYDDTGAGLNLDKLNYTRVNIGPEYETKIGGKLKINVSGGITVANKLEWTDSDSETALDLSPENKYFLRATLKFGR
ncbi:DUF6268 family outer membrane beta-barrel protein [Aquimarina hainanensis]|uniref:DUF6268 family outer membrane beta-barrel protein n=1 Tax=Aquimarina hainanensis TaxID=1578017 RepID=A0ABW5N9J5_9FLAO